MRHIFIIDGGNAAEEFPFGSMLYSFSSTNGDHVNIQVCRRCKMNPCRCTMAEEKLLRTVKRKPVPYCSETMLENLRKQDTRGFTYARNGDTIRVSVKAVAVVWPMRMPP